MFWIEISLYVYFDKMVFAESITRKTKLYN